MKVVPDKEGQEIYKLHFFDAISANPKILLWLVDSDYQVIFSNNSYKANVISITDNEKITIIVEEEFVSHPFRSYLESLYKEAIKGHVVHKIIRLPNERWIRFWLYPGKAGISSVVGFGSDITNEMASRISLIKSEQMFRNIFESLQDIYFKCKIDGTVLMMSPSVKSITGYGQEELLGKDITNYYLYSTTSKTLLKALVEQKTLKNIELSLIDKSGRIIPSLCTLRLIYDEGWIIEGNVKDIAEIKQVHERLQNAISFAERSLKIKEKFLANMSHEIRTPLNGIIGMINVLERTNLDLEQMDQVSAIKQSSDVLLSLLNNLLDWAKLEAGKMEVQMKPVSLQRLLNKIELMYQQKVRENNISFTTNNKEDIPEFILSDEVKLIQVISNLVSNAIKFTPEGGTIKVDLELLSEVNNQVKVKCTVEDTGLGITTKEKARLFGSFTQLDSSENKKHEGAGLGLSISKELVTLLGGEIGVESTYGQGSIFWFTFRAEITEKKHQPVSRLITIGHKDYNPRVLIVDDNKINLEVAAQILKNAGGDIQIAGSGRKAISLMQEDRFDIILLDIQMPEMSGIEVFEWIKREVKEIPPVVALTAYNSESEMQKYLALGFTDFIGKPYNPEELLLKIKELTARQEQVVDQNVLNKLRRYGGADMVKEALHDFCKDTEKLIKECFVTLPSENHKQILDNLHTIKGNAGTLGVNKVARCAMYMEDSLRKGHVLRLEEELNDLQQFFKEFKTLYLEQL